MAPGSGTVSLRDRTRRAPLSRRRARESPRGPRTRGRMGKASARAGRRGSGAWASRTTTPPPDDWRGTRQDSRPRLQPQSRLVRNNHHRPRPQRTAWHASLREVNIAVEREKFLAHLTLRYREASSRSSTSSFAVNTSRPCETTRRPSISRAASLRIIPMPSSPASSTGKASARHAGNASPPTRSANWTHRGNL